MEAAHWRLIRARQIPQEISRLAATNEIVRRFVDMYVAGEIDSLQKMLVAMVETLVKIQGIITEQVKDAAAKASHTIVISK